MEDNVSNLNFLNKSNSPTILKEDLLTILIEKKY